MRTWASFGILALLLISPTLAAAAYRAPRTSSGHPDLEGVWSSNFILPVEATMPGTPLVVSEDVAGALARRGAADIANLPALRLDPEVDDITTRQAEGGLAIVRGERRTRQLVQPADGRLPLTAAGRAQLDRVERAMKSSVEPRLQADNPEERPNAERCIVGQGQPPITGLTSLNPRQIVQTADTVVIWTEYGSDVRIIPIAHDHGSPALVSALGDSIAHWEGETLVVETVRLPSRDAIRPFPTILVPTTATVVERFTRVSERELLYQYTVIDPATYTAPWLGEYSLYHADGRLFEFACHEGNYSLPGILGGARAQEREEAAKTPSW